jgi:hypothetical protein
MLCTARLVFQDNGPGMNATKLFRVCCLGYTTSRSEIDKSGHHGIGYKSSVMKLGKDALALTKTSNSRSAVFMSRTMQERNVTTDDLMLPFVRFTDSNGTWSPSEDRETQDSLQQIFAHSSIRSLEELQFEFDQFGQRESGLRIIIDNIADDCDFESKGDDIFFQPVSTASREKSKGE